MTGKVYARELPVHTHVQFEKAAPQKNAARQTAYPMVCLHYSYLSALTMREPLLNWLAPCSNPANPFRVCYYQIHPTKMQELNGSAVRAHQHSQRFLQSPAQSCDAPAAHFRNIDPHALPKVRN